MDYLDPKPARLRRQKRRDKRLTDGISGRATGKLPRTRNKRRYRAELEEENLPRREPMTVHFDAYFRQSFTSNYTAIENYLRKGVGRPWDKVYQELCDKLGNTRRNGRPLREVVWFFVARQVVTVEGELHKVRDSVVHPLPLPAGSLFLDPSTQVLRSYIPKSARQPPSRRAKRRKEKRKRKYLLSKGINPKRNKEVVVHPVVRLGQKPLLVGGVYDLLLRRGWDTLELRIQLEYKSKHRDPDYIALSCRHRKGRLADWFSPDQDVRGTFFKLFLYADGRHFLEWHREHEYFLLDRATQIELWEAGKLLVRE